MADEQPKIEEKTAIVLKVTEPEAFQLYLEMGVERSLSKLRDLLGNRSVASRTMEEWSRLNKWVIKSDEFDKKQHDEIFKQALKKSVRSKSDILMICQAVLGQFAVDLKGEQIIIKRKDKDGKEMEEIKINRYHPSMTDVEKAYRIIKEEIGEGLPEFSALKEINLTAVFQQIFKNAESTKQSGESGTVDTRPTP